MVVVDRWAVKHGTVQDNQAASSYLLATRVCVCVCVEVGYKLDMGHASSRFHLVLPAYRSRVGTVRLPVDLSAAVRLVFVQIADDAVPRFKVKRRKTGLFPTERDLCYFT